MSANITTTMSKDSDTPASVQPSPPVYRHDPTFLSLPYEVRTTIYKHLFQGAEINVKVRDDYDVEDHDHHWHWVPLAKQDDGGDVDTEYAWEPPDCKPMVKVKNGGLLLVGRQIYHEAKPFFLPNATFKFSGWVLECGGYELQLKNALYSMRRVVVVGPEGDSCLIRIVDGDDELIHIGEVDEECSDEDDIHYCETDYVLMASLGLHYSPETLYRLKNTYEGHDRAHSAWMLTKRLIQTLHRCFPDATIRMWRRLTFVHAVDGVIEASFRGTLCYNPFRRIDVEAHVYTGKGRKLRSLAAAVEYIRKQKKVKKKDTAKRKMQEHERRWLRQFTARHT